MREESRAASNFWIKPTKHSRGEFSLSWWSSVSNIVIFRSHNPLLNLLSALISACPLLLIKYLLTHMRTATDLNDQLQPNSYQIKTAYRGDSSRSPSLLMWWRSMKVLEKPSDLNDQLHTQSNSYNRNYRAKPSSQNHYNFNICLLVS